MAIISKTSNTKNKVFSYLDTQFTRMDESMRNFLSKTLGVLGKNYTPATLWGQIVEVLRGSVQNIMFYLEDALTEQNIFTAERKKSIYGLSRLTGHNPSLGIAAKGNLTLRFKPNSILGTNERIFLNNKTKCTAESNGMVYTIIIPQNILIFDLSIDRSEKTLSVVEGQFETQEFVSNGGQLYSINVKTALDVDIEYLSVRVNNKIYKNAACLYDMRPMEEAYVVRTGLDSGIDIIFGNGAHGRPLDEGDTITVEYLKHSGELGNIYEQTNFTIIDSVYSSSGEEIDANSVFSIEMENSIVGGSNSEPVEVTRNMCGFNSRSLVLAAPENYKLFLGNYSFIGYNNVWTNPGDLIINALIIPNFQSKITDDYIKYFSLAEDDFKLGEIEKTHLFNALDKSGAQLAGSELLILDPIIRKYAAYIFIKMKEDVIWDKEDITKRIKERIGRFFTKVEFDKFIPKSDIITTIKNDIDTIDSIDIYFISEENENAKLNGYYYEYKYKFDSTLKTYIIDKTKVYCEKGKDQGLGLDEHGNIKLNSKFEFPVIMGDWFYMNQQNIYENEVQSVLISDPVMISIS